MFREGRHLTTLLAALWLTAPLIGGAQSEPSKGTTFQAVGHGHVAPPSGDRG
jgi:hypothetical protein